MKTKQQTASELDNPAYWHQRMRPSFDVQKYQQRINKIVGLNTEGKPIIRLVWGQDVRQHIFGEEMPRYWTKRQLVGIAGTAKKYWSVPRWILEKRIELGQYEDAWNATRWSTTDPLTGEPVDKGPPPHDYYVFAYLCAEHERVDPDNGWALCCTRVFEESRARCWGKYREPSEDDLQLVAKAMREMEAAAYRDPYRPLTRAELAEIEIAANMQAERANEEMAAREAEMMREAIKLHGWRIFEHSPKALHHGRIFDMNRQSGLYIPRVRSTDVRN